MQVKIGPVFQAGQYISDSFFLGQIDPFVIIAPDAWTGPANLRFLFSPDNITFYPVWAEQRAYEVICPAGAAIKLEKKDWPNGTYLKFVSSFGGANVAQTAQRTFKVIAT
jgi:hypothetical protein